MNFQKKRVIAMLLAGGKGVIHWKNAARKVSRLAKAVNGIEA